MPLTRGRPAREPVARRVLRGERGTVTAELALTLPAVVLVLLLATAVVAASLAQVRCTDAATAAARAAAVGEPQGRVVAIAHELAGPDAQVIVEQDEGWATVTVTRAVHHRVPGLASLRSSATARAPLEMGEP